VAEASTFSNIQSVGQLATLSCVTEVLAPKAGNVHPAAAFDDVTCDDFIRSAHAIGPAMDAAQTTGVGTAALAAVRATRAVTSTNTNLGMILLLAPLCAVPRDEPLTTGVARVLESLSLDDAARVYEAIALAKPGGLGSAEQGDVTRADVLPLRQAMGLAAQRDTVARQYVNGFHDVLHRIAPALVSAVARGLTLQQAIVQTHLLAMAQEPDSLIRRKCGDAVAIESAKRAKIVLDANWPGGAASGRAFVELDTWLRADGHRRNPGTSADLVCAALFAGFREGVLAADKQAKESVI
jgi:triphosphoribosyl-dephospho-CoA synthase